MSLIYAPVSAQTILCHSADKRSAMLTFPVLIGVHPARGGDDHLHDAHRPVAIHVEEEAVHVHFGKSDSS